MTVEFDYTADISWLSDAERKKLKEDLNDCCAPSEWLYFDMDRKTLSIGARYWTDDDNYHDGREAVEYVLNHADVDWTGDWNEYEPEPDWDAMPGGVDYEFDRRFCRSR